MAQITLNSTGVASNGSLLLQSNGTTTAVTIDASQKVGIGVTPTYVLDVQTSSTTSVARVQNTTASSAAISVLHNSSSAGFNSAVYGSTYASGTVFSVGASGAALYTTNAGPFGIGTYGVAQPLNFSTNSVERMVISSVGNVSIGGTPNASYNLYTENDNTTTGASQYSIAAISTLSGTTFSASFLSQLRIAASTTAASAAGLRIVNPSLASGASITDNYGIYIDNLTSGTNNYGIRSLVSSGTNKYNIYASGTAANYFAGDLLVGKTASGLTTNGFELNNSSTTAPYLAITNSTATSGDGLFTLNRQSSDGTLVKFRQANTDEGSISVSGTTVSYNGGHLSRWAQTTTAKDESLVKGTVLSNLDEMNVYTDAEGNPVDNEQLNKVKVSDVEGDANVAGVFVNWTHDDAHNVDEINMAMTGDMIIRIAQGVTVARGDLLMSAGDGTAKPQGDDIVRSKTIAKVTSTHVTCTYADGSFCVPCVLMAC